ncbi:MAG: hypothetical protein ACFB5Z_03860 [Elainellaceae cyanobacterium]
MSCARANARRGATAAAKSCGYGEDVSQFESALKEACDDMGVDVATFSEVVDDVLDDAQ